jgi:2-dehydropantoate 2-reductase
MRVVMVGAGGIGGYVGARLIEAGEDVTFIARGRHLAAMQANGLLVKSPLGDIHIASPKAVENSADVGEVDVVVFAVKAYDAELAVASMVPLMGPKTVVVTFQNGVDSLDLLSRALPKSQIVGGATYISAFIEAPGVIVHAGATRMVTGGKGNANVGKFIASCNKRGIEAEAIDDIESVLWEKFVILSAFSGATTLMRSGIGPILLDPDARHFIEQLRNEGAAVAAAAGHPMGLGFDERAMSRWTILPPDARSSMANDLAAGKPIELKWLSGRMHSLGESLGVPTPGHSAVFRALNLHAGGVH